MKAATSAAIPCERITMTVASTIGESAVEFERGVVKYSGRGKSSPAANTQVLETGVSSLSFDMQDLTDSFYCLWDELYETLADEEPNKYKFQPRARSATAATAASRESHTDTDADDSIHSSLLRKVKEDDIDLLVENEDQIAVGGPVSPNRVPDDAKDSAAAPAKDIRAEPMSELVDLIVSKTAWSLSRELGDEDLQSLLEILDEPKEMPMPDPVLSFVEIDSLNVLLPTCEATDERIPRASAGPAEISEEDDSVASEADSRKEDEPFECICWELDVKRLSKAYREGQLEAFGVRLFFFAVEIENERKKSTKPCSRPISRRRPEHPNVAAKEKENEPVSSLDALGPLPPLWEE